MTRWHTTRTACAGLGLGMVVVGWLALFTWNPSPAWARWTIGAGAALAALAAAWRHLGG